MQHKKHNYPFYCGTSNIVLPVPNKAHYPAEYQDKSRLHYYASFFNSLEVNSTFYKIPMGQTVEKWANDVPADFKFSFKLWKGITHSKELSYDIEDIERFLRVINMAGDKKGCLLIQFPASITGSYFHRLRKLLDDIRHTSIAHGWKLALEFRHNSWYRDTVYQLLEQHGAAVVVHDMPKSRPPFIDMDTSFTYVRFHGEEGDYRGTYSKEHLEEYVLNIEEWVKDGKEVFAYFNNTVGGAVHNALKLKDLYTDLPTTNRS